MEEILNILKLHLFFREDISEQRINKYIDLNLIKCEESGFDEEGQLINEYKLKKKIFLILKNDLVSMISNIEKALFFTIIDDEICDNDKNIIHTEINTVKQGVRPDFVKLCLDQVSRFKNNK